MSDNSTHKSDEPLESGATSSATSRAGAAGGAHHREPFALAPDPDHFFPSAGQVGAYNRVIAGLENGARLAAVFGGPGSGKTLLMRRMERDLAARGWVVQSAYRAVFGFHEFLESCCRKLGDTQPPQGLNAQLNALHRILTDTGSRVAVLVDEAESTRDQVLDAIMRLSQLGNETSPLVQVVAFGQQALSRKLRALASRPKLDVQASLKPYSDDDVSAYMLWQLRESGLEPRDKFSAGAVKELCASSAGVPGRVNLLCASALLEAELANRLPVDAGLVREAAGELGMYAFSGARDETSWFRDEDSYRDDALGGSRSGPVTDIETFRASSSGTAWSLDEDDFGPARQAPRSPQVDDHSLPLLERAAPLIDDPFLSEFEQPAERRAEARPSGQPPPLARPPARARAPGGGGAPRRVPDKVDIDLGSSLDDLTLQGAEETQDFSLDSLARDDAGRGALDRLHRPARADAPAPGERGAANPRDVGALAPRGPSSLPADQSTRLSPGRGSAASAMDEATSTATGGDDLYGRSEPAPVDWSGRTGELTEQELSPAQRIALQRGRRPPSAVRRLLRATGVLAVLLAAPLAAARLFGVPPQIEKLWYGHAPEEVRNLPVQLDTWLDARLAGAPWRAVAPEADPDPGQPVAEDRNSAQAVANTPSAQESGGLRESPGGAETPGIAGDAGATGADGADAAAEPEPGRSEAVTAPPARSSAESPGGLDEEVAELSERVMNIAQDADAGRARAAEARAGDPAGMDARMEEGTDGPPDSAAEPAQVPAVDGQVEAAAPSAREPAPAAGVTGDSPASGGGARPTGAAAEAAVAEGPEVADTAGNALASAERARSAETPPAGGETAAEATRETAPETSSAAPAPEDETVTRRAPAGPPLLATSVQGREDEPVKLDVAIGRHLEGRSLTLELYGVPRGASLSVGSADADAWRLSAARRDELMLTPAPDSDRDFALQWRLIDDTTGELLDTARSTVVIEAQADAPTVSAKASAGDQFTAIPLEIRAAATDRDGSERVSILVTGAPDAAPLTPGRRLEDGSWLLRPDQLEGLIVTPGEGAPPSIELTVTAVAKERNNGHEARSSTAVTFGVVPSTQ